MTSGSAEGAIPKANLRLFWDSPNRQIIMAWVTIRPFIQATSTTRFAPLPPAMPVPGIAPASAPSIV
ncbi:hypothetical protein PAT3040_07246 [Paenibacillus agaridevorans]|uniref:Uncharacterized protein n=1 Tax=Paenibacillus agaridevorans TaxID=171404 RepID=A0A2R5F6U7_9BACL|nr:hypothetical protein PAT3040_07246 [Paenibacillus agaridevorans]